MSDKPTHICVMDVDFNQVPEESKGSPYPKKDEAVTVINTMRRYGGDYYILAEYPDNVIYRSDMFKPIQHDFTNKLTAKLAKAGQKDYVEYNPEEFKIPVITEETLKQDF